MPRDIKTKMSKKELSNKREYNLRNKKKYNEESSTDDSSVDEEDDSSDEEDKIKNEKMRFLCITSNVFMILK